MPANPIAGLQTANQPLNSGIVPIGGNRQPVPTPSPAPAPAPVPAPAPTPTPAPQPQYTGGGALGLVGPSITGAVPGRSGGISSGLNTQPRQVGPNEFGIERSRSDYASATQAEIARRNYAEYKKTFLPLQEYLASLIDNPAYFGAQVGQSVNNFNQSFDSSLGQYQRDLGRYGLQLTPEQQQSQDRQNNITRATGNVEALNRANRGYRDLEYAILGAGSSTANPTVQQAQGNG